MKSELAAAAVEVGTGRVEDLGELAAMVGVASTFSKSASGAGTIVARASKVINAVGDGKGGAKDQKADFLKKIGATSVHGDRARYRVLKAHLDEQEAEAKAQGETFDKDAYLAKQGFGESTERAAAIGMADNVDLQDIRAANVRKTAADGKGALAANQKYLDSDVARNNKSKARGQIAQRMTGREFKAKQIELRNAAAELESLNLVDEEKQKVADAIAGGFGAKEWLGFKPETQRRIEERMGQRLQADAQNKGIDLFGEGLTEAHKETDQAGRSQWVWRAKTDAESVKRMKALGVRGDGPDSVDAGVRAMARDPAKAKAMQGAAAGKVPAGAKAGVAPVPAARPPVPPAATSPPAPPAPMRRAARRPRSTPASSTAPARSWTRPPTP
jgi:hypothetical protein